MLVASWRRALRTRMGSLLGAAGDRVAPGQLAHTLLDLSESVADATASGAADHIVAVESGLERDRREEIFVEFFAELPEFIEGEIAELAAFFEAVPDRVADLL